MGSYIENHLVKGETIKISTEYHWVIFFSINSFITLFIYPLCIKRTSEFVITNKRVIIKTGIIARRIFEMNIHKVESLDVNQSILGRLLNYGEIRIIGTGGTKETYKFISNPIKFRKRFQEIAF